MERLKKLYASLVKPGSLVFDVGAHTGAMAELFLALGARVVCIEPQPSCVETLRAKFSGRSDVAIEAIGAGAAAGVLELSICKEGAQSSTFSEKWQQGRFAYCHFEEKVSVPVGTLDALIGKYGIPAFCKIDVEGYETEVLRGLNKGIPQLSFEFTKEYLADAIECMRRVDSISPSHFNVSLYNRYRLALPRWIGADEMAGYLERIPEPDLCGDIYCRSLVF
jgi:FkbM family methyltransferase